MEVDRWSRGGPWLLVSQETLNPSRPHLDSMLKGYGALMSPHEVVQFGSPIAGSCPAPATTTMSCSHTAIIAAAAAACDELAHGGFKPQPCSLQVPMVWSLLQLAA